MLQALQYSMSFFDAEKSGSLTSNDISWRGDSALSDALNGASLAGGFYDGGNGRHTSSHMQTKSKVYAFWRHNGGLWMHNQKQPGAKHVLSNLGSCREPKKRASQDCRTQQVYAFGWLQNGSPKCGQWQHGFHPSVVWLTLDSTSLACCAVNHGGVVCLIWHWQNNIPMQTRQNR